MADKVEMWESKNGHRWRIRNEENGNIRAACTKGYSNKADCIKSMLDTQAAIKQHGAPREEE